MGSISILMLHIYICAEREGRGIGVGLMIRPMNTNAFLKGESGRVFYNPVLHAHCKHKVNCQIICSARMVCRGLQAKVYAEMICRPIVVRTTTCKTESLGKGFSLIFNVYTLHGYALTVHWQQAILFYILQ